MISVKSKHNRNFIETVVAASGTIDVLFESAILSGVSVDSYLDPGTDLIIEEASEDIKILKPAILINRNKVLIKALNNQNFQDLTIQTIGSIEQLFDFAIENKVSVTGAPIIGNRYLVPEVDPDFDMVNYFKTNGIKIATGSQAAQEVVNDDCVYADCDYVEHDYWE